MRHAKSCLAFLSLAALFLAFGTPVRAEEPSTGSQTAAQLTPELKTIGDFALFDSKGELFALGRILVDFASVYEVLAKYPEARGECPFRFVQYTDGKQGKLTMRKMRYFFRPEKSQVYLNSDMPGAELQLEFDFDVGKTFLEGTIKAASTAGLKDAGTCKIRIK
jgi:hypothetical protein